MSTTHITEEELLKDLDAYGAHAEELAELLLHESTPLERLKGSVVRYDRPFDSVWEEHFNSDEDERDKVAEDCHKEVRDR
tara:strand:- start:1204 stop:1443 length:240 start_codon:yes stop_codon:yes gene_type:complete